MWVGYPVQSSWLRSCHYHAHELFAGPFINGINSSGREPPVVLNKFTELLVDIGILVAKKTPHVSSTPAECWWSRSPGLSFPPRLPCQCQPYLAVGSGSTSPCRFPSDGPSFLGCRRQEQPWQISWRLGLGPLATVHQALDHQQQWIHSRENIH